MFITFMALETNLLFIYSIAEIEVIKGRLDDPDAFIRTEIRINLIHQISWHYMILKRRKIIQDTMKMLRAKC